MTETTRRTVIAGAAGLSATVALTACGDDTADTDTGDAAGQPADQATPTGTSTANGGAAAGLAALADIPVNGGKIFAAEKVVVTQPTAGEVKAFSTTCTHQGCAVSKVENGLIVCPCHDSKFKISDGTPTGGPATKPLQSKSVKVEGGQIVLS
ncbi:Rieske (2Fe-2S) protein [Virgisporangium ochraceum]|uniref:Cytochrome bc1 complex Rieske iron-sulfur subunit n=1 Tax=Virgisporangium ochraceum TaxID=65505 RepID=A0A8J4A6T4_9ACTN|nr:Rieske (2Fe-2S) protein [Virgisporangium ochraceum]GIJ74925.1 iron-sulfur protein [Virgisporangium ochraceum]